MKRHLVLCIVRNGRWNLDWVWLWVAENPDYQWIKQNRSVCFSQKVLLPLYFSWTCSDHDHEWAFLFPLLLGSPPMVAGFMVSSGWNAPFHTLTRGYLCQKTFIIPHSMNSNSRKLSVTPLSTSFHYSFRVYSLSTSCVTAVLVFSPFLGGRCLRLIPPVYCSTSRKSCCT